jgi:hypothetical protein
MKDLRLIILFTISTLIGTLGGACVILFPLFLLMFAAGDAGHIDASSASAFFLLFVIEFAIAGILTAIMMRTFIGTHIITVKDGAIRFAIGSVIGGLMTSASLSIEDFNEAIALGIVITYAIGGTLCWLKIRANEREFVPETVTTLNLDGRK